MCGPKQDAAQARRFSYADCTGAPLTDRAIDRRVAHIARTQNCGESLSWQHGSIRRVDLVHAGAVLAIELDMNPEWPTFNTYAHHHGLRPTQFVPNYQQPLDRYLTPDSREFFAIYRRLPGASRLVPFR